MYIRKAGFVSGIFAALGMTLALASSAQGASAPSAPATIPANINVTIPNMPTPGGNLATLYYNHNGTNGPNSTTGNGTLVIGTDAGPLVAGTPLPSAAYSGAGLLACLGLWRLCRKSAAV